MNLLGRTLVLALALSLLAAGARARHLLQSQQQAESDGIGLDVDIIIIGAGMAGITAARNLTDAGLRVLVLEARNRAGGRLDAVQVPGGTADLGAMWIHEAVAGNNALFDLVQQLGLPVSPRQDYSSLSTFNHTTGDRVGRGAYVKVYSAIFSQLRPRMAAMRAVPGTSDASLADVYTSWLAGNPQLGPSDVSLANTIMHTTYQALLNGNITALSTLRLGDAKSIPAVDVMLRDGFPAVVEALKGGLDIRYSTVVASIDLGPDSVTVTTADGQAFTAPYAILTTPLSLLKENTIAIQPPLPEPKLQAIRDMGFGVLDKALFVFDAPFWDDTDFILREMPDWSGRFAIFLNYHRLFGLPLLVAIHVADTAVALEALTDEQVRDEGMAVLRSIYQKDGTLVPDPIQFAFTRWATDPYARGAYSYFAVSNSPDIMDLLAEPTGRLLFAGEATSRKPASVTGAYLSGLREAQRVVTLMAAAAGAAGSA